MDTEISQWVLEFLLRQQFNDRIINALISVLPLPDDDYRLMRFILLRRISSEVSTGLISEKILETLEIIEELDRSEGVEILDSMKEAYCAVAVDCTVRFLRENPEDCREYFDAVVRIWRGRIIDMENWGEVGLVSEKLRALRDEIEAAVWSVNSRKNVLLKDTRGDAIKSVGVFLRETVEEMGPSFLERVAKTSNEKGREVQFSNDTSRANQIEKRQGCLSDRLHKNLDASAGNVINNNSIDMDIDSHEVLDAGTENVPNKNTVDMGVDSHTELPDVASNKHNISLTPEVSKVQEGLKSSSIELLAAVKDPLPDALCIAETISSDMAMEEMNHDHSGENQNARGAGSCNHTIEKSVSNVHTKEVDAGNQDAVLRPNIMLRNSTARTFEWDDDSVESSYDRSPNRPILRTPRNRNVSPLVVKPSISKGFARRRKMKKWSSLEEQTLRDAVKQYGRGNWKLILNNFRDVFEERNMVDLKDKWRNMTR